MNEMTHPHLRSPMNIHEAIALLEEELDAQTVVELIEQFLADTPVQIDALRSAAKSDDHSVVGRTAHSVAGSGSTFGLQELRMAALALEENALAGECEKVPQAIATVAAAYRSSIPALCLASERLTA